jgi:NADH-quinone oxidoreductase subunit G
MPKLTIDGQEIEFEPGQTVIRAAASAGVTIPHYCYHPGLSVAGNCRMCLVEIEKMPKLSIACSTACADGMIVRTKNERVREARDAIMEFLLINHPLDCPICDQAGECRLQQYSYKYGQGASRFLEEKVHKPKNVDIGPHITLDSERCILCTRCVRFTKEISKTDELNVGFRGDHAIIETFPGTKLDNAYSGNTVDICPVGALTLNEFRFKSRVWFLKDTASVCPGCARGCSITVGSRDEEILRYVPRENPRVNAWWMCDEGRLSFKDLKSAPRLATPAAKQAPRTTWVPALDEAAQRIAELRKKHGAGSVAMLASPRSTNEDLYLAALLARDGLGGPDAPAPVYLATHERGADDALLIRKDKSPNARGAGEILGALLGGPAAGSPAGKGIAGSGTELAAAIRAGRVKALVMFGSTTNGLDPNASPGTDGASGGSGLTADDLAKLDALILVDAFRTKASDFASVSLPAHAFGEIEGSFTNFQGHVQRVRASVSPHADSWPAWKIAQELARRLGASAVPQFTGAQAVFAALAAAVPAFSGLSYAKLGPQGAPLPSLAGTSSQPGAAGAGGGGE